MELGLQYSRGSNVWSLLLDGHAGEKQTKKQTNKRCQYCSCVRELCESGGGRPSLIVITVSMDVKQH